MLQWNGKDLTSEDVYFMSESFSRAARSAREMARMLLRWLVLALPIGLLCGGIGTAFHLAVEAVTELRGAHGWLLWLLPAGGALIALAYKLCRMEKDRGTNLVLTAVRSTEHISLLTAPLIFFSTCLTHLLGGSAGREGAALQMGASLGRGAGRLLRLDDKDMRMMTMCGMSAAFSALFGTPIAAAVFSMEVVSVGVMYYAAIVPCLLSSLAGVWLAGVCGVAPTRFPLEGVPALGWLDGGRVLLLAALCAAPKFKAIGDGGFIKTEIKCGKLCLCHRDGSVHHPLGFSAQLALGGALRAGCGRVCFCLAHVWPFSSAEAGYRSLILEPRSR